MPRHAMLTAAGFAIAAAIGRKYHWSVETRWQILAFWCLALFYEVEIRTIPLHVRPSVAGFFLNGMAATLALLAMKFAIEGLSSNMP